MQDHKVLTGDTLVQLLANILHILLYCITILLSVLWEKEIRKDRSTQQVDAAVF